MRRFLLSIFILLGLCAVAQAQVVLDPAATATAGCVNSALSGSGITTAALNGSTLDASDTVVVAIAVQTAGVAAITGMTAIWDSSNLPVGMTLIGTANNGANATVWFFGLRNPLTGGPRAIAFSWTGSAQIAMSACAYSGVNLTSDATAFKNFNSASGSNTSSSSVTITAGANDYALAAHDGVTTSVSSVNHTQAFIDNSGSVFAVAANGFTGPTPTLTQNFTGTFTTVSAGIDIGATGGGGSTAKCGRLGLTGAGC